VKEFFFTVFEFIGQFFFQNDVFKIQEVFSEHDGIRVLIENGLEGFQKFLIFQIGDKTEMLKIFKKKFWNVKSKLKKPRILMFL
jgi:hypothetical protein